MDLQSLIAKMDAIESLSEAPDTIESSASIANKIRKAVTGLGTNEEEVYSALTDVKDARQWAEIRKIYPEVDADLLDDFSDWLAPELTLVKKLLKQKGIDLGQPIDPQLLKADNSAEMAKIKKLEALVDQYLALKAKLNPTVAKEGKIITAEELLEGMGYHLNEAGVWDTVKKVGGKLALPIGAAMAIWDAWDRLSKLPPNMTPEQTKVEVTRTLSKLIADYGVFWVGGIIGGAIGGAVAGPGALLGFIAGGFAAQYALGDSAEAIVDKVVDYLMKNKAPAAKPAAAQPAAGKVDPAKARAEYSAKTDPDVLDLQKLLKADGYDLGATGINKDGLDGVLGPKTITAIQQDLAKNGGEVKATGVLDQPTADALVKVYGAKA